MNMFPNINLIIDSLGWAVLHSIWQGVIAAVIVYTVRAVSRERASEFRYFVGIVTLCALLCAFIGTFLYYYNTGSTALPLGLGGAETINLVLPSIGGTIAANPLLRLGDFTGLIGIFWAVCFAVLAVRYLTAFRLTHKLRNNGLSDLPNECQARFRALVELSGVTPKVRAYFSAHVSSPITFGTLKPIILVPAWFFTGMTPEQCEAVLLHELAHIRRHDYLTNILQIAIKTVFFYHPAVQFICINLDTDREHACDDFAVMLTKNPEGLATALGTIRLKAARGGGVFALSADGNDAPLMYRLKRLMGTGQSTDSLQRGTSRGLAATAMLSASVALVMTVGATTSEAHPQKDNPEVLEDAGSIKLKAWGSSKTDTVTVKGITYKATSFDFRSDGKGTDTINGKEYPSKYAYSVYSNNGKSYVVKKKNGKRYMEIGDNWYRVDEQWPRNKITPPTPPAPQVLAGATTPPITTVPSAPSAKTYWVSDQVRAATETRAEQASNRMKAANERAAEARSRKSEQTDEWQEAQEWREAEREWQASERERTQEMAELERELAEDMIELEQEFAEELEEMAREIAEEKADLAMEYAKEQAELKAEYEGETNARARQQQMRNIEQNTRNYEQLLRNQEQRVRDAEQRTRDFEERIRDKQRTMRDHERRNRDKEQKIRDKQQKTHQKAQAKRQKKQYAMLEVNRIKADEQRHNYEKMRDRLVSRLLKDGYMKSDQTPITIKMTKTDIFINGKKLAEAQEEKYCDIVSDYMDRKGDMKKIVIKPGYLHVDQEDPDGHSNYSYTRNE